MSYSSLRELVEHEGLTAGHVELRFGWELPSVILASIKASQDIEKTQIWDAKTHVVLVTDPKMPENMAATTCNEYIKKTWDQKYSSIFLEIMDDIKEHYQTHTESIDFHLEWKVEHSNDTGIFLRRFESHDMSGLTLIPQDVVEVGVIHASDTSVRIFMKSFEAFLEHIGLLDALSWLCSAVRQPIYAHTTYSTSTFKKHVEEEPYLAPTSGEARWIINGVLSYLDPRGRSPYLSFIGKFAAMTVSMVNPAIGIALFAGMAVYDTLSVKQKIRAHDCWQALFKSCMFVSGSLSPRESSWKGLEASFDLLISLAVVKLHLDVDGGIVFVGYRSVIYPTKIQGDCAQFHVITSENSQINPYTLDYSSRVPTKDVKQFESMRCFLGWCEDAQINLGTERLRVNTPRYSGGREKEKSLRKDGYTGIFHLGVSSIMTGSIGGEVNYKYHSHRVQFTPADNYLELLNQAAVEVVLVYDASDKRGWLVPKLSLFLCMCQAYAASNRGTSPPQMPEFLPHSCVSDLINSLSLHEEMEVLGGRKPLLFSDLLFRFSINLLRTKISTKAGEERILYGFELMDVVKKPGSGSCMRRLDLEISGKSWSVLTEVVDAVVVCSGLGDAITARDKVGSECETLPKGSDFLGATMSCLQELTHRSGMDLVSINTPCQLNLGFGHYWDLQEHPIQPCKHGPGDVHCWERENRFQTIIPRSKWNSVRSTWSSFTHSSRSTSTTVNIPRLGAVVFGQPHPKSTASVT